MGPEAACPRDQPDTPHVGAGFESRVAGYWIGRSRVIGPNKATFLTPFDQREVHLDLPKAVRACL